MEMGYNLLSLGRAILNGFEHTYYSLLDIFDPGHVELFSNEKKLKLWLVDGKVS